MAQAWKANRRNIESRMANRSNRVPMTLDQISKQTSQFVDAINNAAWIRHMNAGGLADAFTKPLDGVKLVTSAVKRELKRTGRLDKYSKHYVGA